MYYELMTKQKSSEIKREKILEHREDILRIIDKMLEKDSHLTYEYYDLYKDSLFAFSKEIIDKLTILRSQHVTFDIPYNEGVDKQIMIKPKTKTRTIIEMMKKI
jgi:hypothetical protein